MLRGLKEEFTPKSQTHISLVPCSAVYHLESSGVSYSVLEIRAVECNKNTSEKKQHRSPFLDIHSSPGIPAPHIMNPGFGDH